MNTLLLRLSLCEQDIAFIRSMVVRGASMHEVLDFIDGRGKIPKTETGC